MIVLWPPQGEVILLCWYPFLVIARTIAFFNAVCRALTVDTVTTNI